MTKKIQLFHKALHASSNTSFVVQWHKEGKFTEGTKTCHEMCGKGERI